MLLLPVISLPVFRAPRSQAQELPRYLGQQKERAGLRPGLQTPTQRPPTHYVAVVRLSHEQHAANEVSSGHTLGAFAFPAGRQAKDKAEATGAFASFSSHLYCRNIHDTRQIQTRDCPKNVFLPPAHGIKCSIHLPSLCISNATATAHTGNTHPAQTPHRANPPWGFRTRATIRRAQQGPGSRLPACDASQKPKWWEQLELWHTLQQK